MPHDITFSDDPEDRRWHYRPSDPVALNPLFSWPPDPIAVFNWYRGAWLQITSLTICLTVAVAVWWLMLPPLAEMATFAPGWMARVWLANLLPQIALAAGLHWWLYMRQGQGMQKKFEKRDLAHRSVIFTFDNQVHDNIFWTLGSAITVATVYQWVIFWAMANGYAWTVTFASNPVWFVAWLALIPMWSGLHYYWVHRLEHSPALYRHVHAVHHRNVNIGPWSGISNHWYENLLYFSGYFVHLFVASHPIHVVWHAMFQQLSPVLSHSGFERIIVNETEAAKSGDFFHQLHHKYFECNYGTSEIPFDKWFGTFHDGTAAASRRTKEHKRQMYLK
ncbi:MAG: sterol desaturase family protein [Pseudomonadota bacterium]